MEANEEFDISNKLSNILKLAEDSLSEGNLT